MRATPVIRQLLALFCLTTPILIWGARRPAPGSKPQFVTPPAVQLLSDSAAPLSGTLTLSCDRPVRVALLLDNGRTTRLIYETDAFATGFSLPVLGLRAAATNRLSVIVTDEFYMQTVWPFPLEILTDSLPEPFPAIVTTVSDPARMERGITLFSVSQLNVGYILAIDEAGEVVWLYRQPINGIADIRRIANGHLLFTDAEGGAEIDMLGNVVSRWHPRQFPQTVSNAIQVDAETIHHEISENDHGTVLTLSTELRSLPDYPTSETNPAAPTAPAIVVGDVVLQFDRIGRVVQYWSLLDILDPYRIGFNSLANVGFYPELRGQTRDWSHANAVIHDPSDDSFIVSVRHQDALVKIDRSTGQLIWILGTPDGWKMPWSRYLLTPKGPLQWPYHQHAPTITPRQTLLLFDNGNFRRRPTEPLPTLNYSRVVEFAVDRAQMTAEQLWAYGGPDDELFFSGALGDADWLPITENILVTDGFKAADATNSGFWARIFEVTHTTPASKVFEVLIRQRPGTNLSWIVYRAERLASLYPPQP
jgi:arylsulfate sulfotransferase